MNTVKDIQVYIDRILKDWLPYRSLPVEISFIKSQTVRACVSYKIVKVGLEYVEDRSVISLRLNESILKKDVSLIKKTITHEIYHIIQHNLFDVDELKVLRRESVLQNNISQIALNTLELEAEVFCINLLGASNYSHKEAKESDLYRSTLNTILSRVSI